MKIAGLSSKKLGDSYEGQLKNNYLYQGAYSELDDDIGWHDFYLRNYDAQIGRWVQQDPYQQFASPYVGMGNDPVNNTDPSGGSTEVYNVIKIGGEMSKTAATAITLGEAVVRSVSTVTKTVSSLGSILLKGANIATKAFQVANVLNNAFNTIKVGNNPPTLKFITEKILEGYRKAANKVNLISNISVFAEAFAKEQSYSLSQEANKVSELIEELQTGGKGSKGNSCTGCYFGGGGASGSWGENPNKVARRKPKTEKEKKIEALEGYRSALMKASEGWNDLADAIHGGRDLLDQLTVPGFLKARGEDFIQEVAERVWDKYYSTPEENRKNFDSLKEIQKASSDIINEKINEMQKAFETWSKFPIIRPRI